jgi:hypothetical protein
VTAKWLQLVVLGMRSFIGDMSLTGSSTLCYRSATVAALTQVVAMRISIARFTKVTPPEVLARMRAACVTKDVMTKKTMDEDKEVKDPFAAEANCRMERCRPVLGCGCLEANASSRCHQTWFSCGEQGVHQRCNDDTHPHTRVVARG